MLLDIDGNGLRQDIDYNEREDKTIIKTYQDVEPVLERNKMLQNADDFKKQGIKNGFQQVADIPLAVVHQWMSEGINIFKPEDWPKVKAKLKHPDNRFLRTTLGDI